MSKVNVETLISSVQSRPLLWQDRLPNFKNKNITDKLWAEVGEICGCTRKAAKAKWKNLKDRFRKILQKNPIPKSGSKAHTNKISWEYFDMMTFIKDAVATDPTEGYLEKVHTQEKEIDAIINDLLSEEENVLVNSTPIHSSTEELSLMNAMTSNSNTSTYGFTPVPLKKKKSAPMNIDAEFLKLEKKERMEILKREVERKEDNDNLLFFKSLLPFMEKFDTLEKLEIRTEIQNEILQKLKSKENK